MRLTVVRRMIVWLLLGTAAATNANAVEISGVFGLAPVPVPVAIAVWVPLADGEAVTGVRWYNNDGTAVFPTLLAMAGAVGRPEDLVDAVVVGEDVVGLSSAWSDYEFTQPLASVTDGLYLVFEVPTGGELVSEGEGGGHGVGYQVGDGQIRCWVSEEDGTWHALSPKFQMAVAPVMDTDKSGDVLVLGQNRVSAGTEADPEATPKPLVANMTVAPNPFNPVTEITYSLPTSGVVSLVIYDVRGRIVRTLVDESRGAGVHTVVWDGRDGRGRSLSSGVYLARLQAGAVRLVTRLTLLQ